MAMAKAPRGRPGAVSARTSPILSTAPGHAGENAPVSDGAAIALIDGEHHPSVVRAALDRLEPVAAIFCGGTEKLPPGPLDQHYGRPVRDRPEAALRELAADAARVVDLADEPPLPASAKLRLAALALSL